MHHIPHDIFLQHVKTVATGLRQAGRYDPPRDKITVGNAKYATILEHIAAPVETLLSTLPTPPRGSIRHYMDTMLPKLRSYIPHDDQYLPRNLALDKLFDKDHATVYDTTRFGQYNLYTSALTVLLHWAHDRDMLSLILDVLSDRTNAVFRTPQGSTPKQSLRDAARQLEVIQRWAQWSILASVYDAMEQTDLRDDTPWEWQEPMFCEHVFAALHQYLHDHDRLFPFARRVVDQERYIEQLTNQSGSGRSDVGDGGSSATAF